MSTINKIQSVTARIGIKIRIGIFYLGVHLTPPIKLLSLISISGLVIWHMLVGNFIFKTQAVIFAVVVTVAFFAYVIHLMFPPSKRVEILVDAYGNNQRIIPFIAKRIEKCLKNVIKFIEKQPNIEKQPKKDDIKNVIAGRDRNALEKLQGEFLKPRSTRRLTDGIEKKGNYLNALIGGVSESFRIPRESVEELINTKVDVSQNISKGIVSSYDEIKAYIERLTGIIKGPPGEHDREVRNYLEKRVKERVEDIRKKKESLLFQIKWLEELDKRRESIPRLLEVIKETSTGKAVSKLSKLLLEEAKNEEDILWLVRFANSRKGFPISELLGLKSEETSNPFDKTLEWYGGPISGNLKDEKDFFEYFDWQRDKALNSLWDKFISWNESRNGKEKLNFAQPIAIGLASGYSAALRRILKGICDYVLKYLFSIDAELEDDLNKNIISKKLKDNFERKDFPLSDNAVVTKEKENEWVITEEKSISKPPKKRWKISLNYIKKETVQVVNQKSQKFTVRKEDGKLNIYVQDIKKLHIILISEAPGGDEEVLRAELKADYPGLRCDIMPIDVIKEKEMERQINSIFVGIEGINKQGDIVHPRGGSNVIRKIKEYEADVYAFGESYKVLDFTEADIDYTKLSLSRSENIDYVVTDHGVHEREGNKWKIGEKLEDNLDCCVHYWRRMLNLT